MRDLLLAEIHCTHCRLTLALDEELALAVNEDAPDEIALVGTAVELERVGEKIVYVDDAAVGVRLVLLDIGILPNYMVGVELEHVGVHLEYEQVVGNLQLRLELAAVAVFEPYALVEFAVQRIVQSTRRMPRRCCRTRAV